MTTRPDYVKCAQTGMEGETRSWCGRDVSHEFAFTDPTHAALNGLKQGRLVLCPECRAAIVTALANGSPDTWDDKPDEWSEAIHAAFPTRSGSHDQYAQALQMIGNRHSKGELVSLVNWLLLRLKAAPGADPDTHARENNPKESRDGPTE